MRTLTASLLGGLVLCIVLFVAFHTARSTTPSTSSTYKTVIIDPGHGGIDTGTYYNTINEKDINLSVALKLRDLLIPRGYNVLLTRDKDISLDKMNKSSKSRHKRDLNQRVYSIDSSNAEYFISLHVNSLPGSSEKGPLVFYHIRYPESEKLASAIQHSLNSISYDGYSINTKDYLAANYYLLRQTHKPGVLIELGFITNSQERNLLITDDYQEYLANLIFEGIHNFYNDKHGV